MFLRYNKTMPANRLESTQDIKERLLFTVNHPMFFLSADQQHTQEKLSVAYRTTQMYKTNFENF